jgi:DNA-binding NarL/FixJ family response regulator
MRDMLVERLGRAGVDAVGTAASAQDAVALYERHRPQLVLADVRLKDGDGITLTAELRRRFPDSRVLVISGGDDEGLAQDAVEAGAVGFIPEAAETTELMAGVLSAAQGRQHVYDSVTASQVIAALQSGQCRRPSDLFALTTRERECLEVMATGVTTTRGIAETLHLSQQTIKTHVDHLRAKLGGDSRAAAVARGYEVGLLVARARPSGGS